MSAARQAVFAVFSPPSWRRCALLFAVAVPALVRAQEAPAGTTRERAPADADAKQKKEHSEELQVAGHYQNGIAYFYTSRLRGEPAAGVAGVAFHPAESRSVRFTAIFSYQAKLALIHGPAAPSVRDP